MWMLLGVLTTSAPVDLRYDWTQASSASYTVVETSAGTFLDQSYQTTQTSELHIALSPEGDGWQVRIEKDVVSVEGDGFDFAAMAAREAIGSTIALSARAEISGSLDGIRLVSGEGMLADQILASLLGTPFLFGVAYPQAPVEVGSQWSVELPLHKAFEDMLPVVFEGPVVQTFELQQVQDGAATVDIAMAPTVFSIDGLPGASLTIQVEGQIEVEVATGWPTEARVTMTTIDPDGVEEVATSMMTRSDRAKAA